MPLAVTKSARKKAVVDFILRECMDYSGDTPESEKQKKEERKQLAMVFMPNDTAVA